MQVDDHRRIDDEREADQALQRRLRKLLDRFWQSSGSSKDNPGQR